MYFSLTILKVCEKSSRGPAECAQAEKIFNRTCLFIRIPEICNIFIHLVQLSMCSKQIGCESNNPSWIGDGYCDDVTNNEGCHFDLGDCCGTNVNTQYCTQCICYEDHAG